MNKNNSYQQTKKHISMKRDTLQKSIELYVEQLSNRELDAITILSNEGQKEEAVVISMEEYRFLQDCYKKFMKCSSAEKMLLSIQEDLKKLQEDVDVLKYVR